MQRHHMVKSITSAARRRLPGFFSLTLWLDCNRGRLFCFNSFIKKWHLYPILHGVHLLRFFKQRKYLFLMFFYFWNPFKLLTVDFYRMGEIVVELYWNHAPNTCRNFAGKWRFNSPITVFTKHVMYLYRTL